MTDTKTSESEKNANGIFIHTAYNIPAEHRVALQFLFPRVSGPFAHINLDALVRSNGQAEITYHNNPCAKQKVVDLFHATQSLSATYGGWMENRSFMWKGSYLDEGKKHIHLGIDCNVPAKTPVAFPIPATVVYTRTDPSTEIGWGTYICLQTEKHVYVLGHLNPDIKVRAGDKTKSRELIGTVGTYPQNGNVFEHLHIQVMSLETFNKLKPNLEQNLDGYGFVSEKEGLKQAYPDPLQTICDELGGVEEIHPKSTFISNEQWQEFYR